MKIVVENGVLINVEVDYEKDINRKATEGISIYERLDSYRSWLHF